MRQNLAFRLLATITILLASASAGSAPARADERLSAFMQLKLTHAEKTLEGLTKGDYELIAKHSQAISLLCEDELWSVLQTPEYHERSNEFRRSVNAITTAARKKDLEAATLAYVHATMNCVSCHKYVRENRPKK